MDFPCESEISVQNENALLFTIVVKPAPVIEYVKTIASLIGASHILGIFEDENFIKVYFDDKKYVDTLIRSGIHVLGHHIKVDYVVPPGRKVVLSNVDPIVSNCNLIRLMSMFGSVVSPVFRSPISDDTELCHIDYGSRYVYVDLNTPVPETLEFKYGDQTCKININLDDFLPVFPYVKREPTESNATESSSNATTSDDNSEPINIDDDLDVTDPVVISVQSATEEINAEQQNNVIQPCIGTSNPVSSKRNLYKTRRAKFVKTAQINKKIKQNIKHKNRTTRRYKMSKKREQNKNVTLVKEAPQTPSNQPSSSVCSSSPGDSSTPLSLKDNFICDNSKNILDEDQLKLFLEEVRCQRAPIELVKKYLGADFDSNDLLSLFGQLNDFKKKSDDPSVKVRVNRLMNRLNAINIF